MKDTFYFIPPIEINGSIGQIYTLTQREINRQR